MIDPHLLNKSAHVAAGVLALAAGAIPLLSRKGGRLHRRAGLAFAGVGSVVIGSAALGALLFPQPGPLVAATLSAGYQFTSGLRALKRFRVGPLDALMAAAALVLCLVLIPRMGSGNASWRPATGYSMLGFLTCITLYDLSRHAWMTTWRRLVRPIDHGLKMTGGYFAMAAAGLGNLFSAWQPASSLGPATLGTLVMIALAIHYARTRRRQRPILTVGTAPERNAPALLA